MKYSEQFKTKKEAVQSKYVSAGFDGFVDYVVKPVKTRADEINCTYSVSYTHLTLPTMAVV